MACDQIGVISWKECGNCDHNSNVKPCKKLKDERDLYIVTIKDETLVCCNHFIQGSNEDKLKFNRR